MIMDLRNTTYTLINNLMHHDHSSFMRLVFPILLLGLLLRILILWHNYYTLEYEVSLMQHCEIARNVLDGRGPVINEEYGNTIINTWRTQHKLIDLEDIPPPTSGKTSALYTDETGYGFLLAAIWKIFGSKRWIYIRALQILIDIIMIWMIYEIGRCAFQKKVGLIAALFYACFIPGIEIAVRPHRDIWVTFLFITTVFLLLKSYYLRTAISNLHRRRRYGIVLSSTWIFVFIGAATGFVTWMRSTVVLFVFFVAMVLFLVQPRKQFVQSTIVTIGTFLLVLSPLIVYNYSTFGKFMATRGAFWHAFWSGIGQMPNPLSLQEGDATIQQFAHSLDSTTAYGTDYYEQALRREALRLITQHPGWYISSIMRRAAVIVFPKLGRELFFMPTLPNNQLGMINKKVTVPLLVVIDIILGSLFFAGLWLARKKGRLVLLLLIPYLYTLCTLSPFYVTGRNIANIYYTVFIFDALAITALWQWIAQVRRI